eukprot:scaffold5850_cov363-Prasinococcus_capsulatus_cf.AAC.1
MASVAASAVHLRATALPSTGTPRRSSRGVCGRPARALVASRTLSPLTSRLVGSQAPRRSAAPLLPACARPRAPSTGSGPSAPAMRTATCAAARASHRYGTSTSSRAALHCIALHCIALHCVALRLRLRLLADRLARVVQGLYDVSTARFPAGSRHSWVPSPDRRDEVICMENMEGHLVCDTTNSHFFARTEDWEFVPKFEVHSRLEEEEQRLQQKRASSSSS